MTLLKAHNSLHNDYSKYVVSMGEINRVKNGTNTSISTIFYG